MSLEKTVEIWENGETLEYQIRYFLSIIRLNRTFSHYLITGVPEEFLMHAENYAINQEYDTGLYQKLQQIPTRESLDKKDSNQN
jgi:hypothetical protein